MNRIAGGFEILIVCVVMMSSGLLYSDIQRFPVEAHPSRSSLERREGQDYDSLIKGVKAPMFSGVDIVTGKSVTLSSLLGKFVFINFWGTWCAPCRAELQKLKTAYAKIDHSKVEMVNIASRDRLAELKKFVVQQRMRWPQLLSSDITKKYNIDAFPSNFVIGPDGNILFIDVSVEDLHVFLNALANGISVVQK